ncbi:hypothetical protein OF83DRAFT_254403 [Amylostereum chailletii]|nr:hypothetical protein OF83DRAFT_254403 [Amylostereum chailletii]
MALHSKVPDCPSKSRKRCPLRNCPLRHRIPNNANMVPTSSSMTHKGQWMPTVPVLYPPPFRACGLLPSYQKFVAGTPRIPRYAFPGPGPVLYRLVPPAQATRLGPYDTPLCGPECVFPRPIPPPRLQPQFQPQAQPPVGIFAPKKPIPCLFFAKGGCVYGDACSFIHDTSLCDVQDQEFGGRKLNGTVYYPLPTPPEPSLSPLPPPPPPMLACPSRYAPSLGGMYPVAIPYGAGFVPNGIVPIQAPLNDIYSLTPPDPSCTFCGVGSIAPPTTSVPSDVLLPLNGTGSGNVSRTVSGVADDIRAFPHRPSESVSSLSAKKGHVRRISVAVKSEVENTTVTEQVGVPPGGSRRHRRTKLGPNGQYQVPMRCRGRPPLVGVATRRHRAGVIHILSYKVVQYYIRTSFYPPVPRMTGTRSTLVSNRETPSRTPSWATTSLVELRFFYRIACRYLDVLSMIDNFSHNAVSYMPSQHRAGKGDFFNSLRTPSCINNIITTRSRRVCRGLTPASSSNCVDGCHFESLQTDVLQDTNKMLHIVLLSDVYLRRKPTT